MNEELTKEKLLFLKNKALNLRIDSIRATTASKSGHPTSCMSAADLISTIFFHFLKYDLKNPKNPNNDRFILSKGHAIPVVYAAWKGLGVISDEELLNLRKFDSVLEGHPTSRFKYNEAATGSLGQGLAIGVGMAINAKHENLDYKTYVMLGDGEIAEGSVWEACELAAYYKLDNLIAIVDCNRLGQSGSSLHGHEVEKIAKKFEAFGFKTYVIDGHNIEQIFETIQDVFEIKYKPTVIIAKTFKGYSLEKIQDKLGFHGKPFKKEDLDKIIDQLKNKFPQAAQFEPSEIYKPKLNEQKAVKVSIKKITLDLNKDSNSSIFDNGKEIATRKAFGYALEALGCESKNIFVLDGDVKNSTFTEIFEEKFQERFIQCFIAEQSMVGISTGLVLRDKIPFAATFGAFFTRAYDQIRMAGIGCNALRLVGSHCGVSIGADGPSQMGLEDIAMIRVIPNSIVLYPSDGVSAYKLTELMANYHDGISYLRTSRPSTPIIYDKNEEFKIGGCKVLKQSDNDKCCIIAAGITLIESLKAYEELKSKGVLVSVIDLYSVKPLDEKTIREISKKSDNKIVTVEDHYLQGGMGEAVNSIVVNDNIKIKNLSVKILPRSGTKDELLKYAQIDCQSIVRIVNDFI
ncbi:transketolase [Candidatus Babeliales bacterium]|nr:transketolase [Candidatus Babeliales bacterium]